MNIINHRPGPLVALGVVAQLLALGKHAVLAAEVEAYAGAPFGVGRITLGVASDQPVLPLQDERFTVASADGRVLYPVLKEEPVRRIIRRLLEIDSPASVTIYFVFHGNQPFDMEAFAPMGQTLRVTPRPDARGHRRLLEQWWQQYVTRWQSLRQDPQFPPVVENFLAANLARRLGVNLPEPRARLLSFLSPQKTVWDELMVTEAQQLAIDQSLLAGAAADAGVLQPLPAPMPWYDLPPAGEELTGVAVEPIALRVPVECFYLRFGNFTNYLWFRDLNRKWQGDLANMLRRRGIDRAASGRIERQLSLRETGLAKILGPHVISDVAIVGLDPHVAQGAAVGILFEAKNTVLLANDLNGKRREALTTYPDATETAVRVADRDVSLIATPGGEVRSYYVADGNYHLVTTSRRLVQRFLLAGKGEQSLASSTGFLQVRKQLPLEREDSIFVYLPPEFFRELTGPAAWIESQRRTRSMREMKLLELARLQAAAEGVAATTREELIAAGMLPAGFGARGDGSELREDETGAVDSLRGSPGLFLPAGEMEVAAVTAAEVAGYRAFVDRFRQEVGQLPPIAAGVRRIPLADGTGETMAIDVLATPLADVKLGKLPDALGEPSDQRVAPIEGDLVRGEFVLDSPLPLGALAEPHHLFFALRDFRTPLVVERGKLAGAGPPTELIRMYVGAWPKPGLLRLFAVDEIAAGPEPAPAANDAWQAGREDFLLMSFKPDLVREVLPQLQLTPVEQPAQAWLEVADLHGTQLEGTVNALGYMRARETSVAACRLMNTLANQLHVPRETCRETAERLMDGQFVCALGGEYELVDIPGGQPMWTSTALAPENRFLLTEPPEGFQLALLTWFKGFRGEARLEDDAITAHIELDMAKSAVP